MADEVAAGGFAAGRGWAVIMTMTPVVRKSRKKHCICRAKMYYRNSGVGEGGGARGRALLSLNFSYSF